MLRIFLSLVIAAHGIGHILFLGPLLGIAEWNQAARIWWLSSEAGISRYVGGVLFLVAIIGFCAAVYGLWNQLEWWRSAAIIASTISTVGLILFWLNPITSPAVSAMAFNLLVLGSLLIVQYPSVETVGA